jgi:hypothetical protein
MSLILQYIECVHIHPPARGSVKYDTLTWIAATVAGILERRDSGTGGGDGADGRVL